MNGKIKASKVENYLQVYRLHIINAKLEDDSETVSVDDLINYVDNHIDQEDKDWYGARKD